MGQSGSKGEKRKSAGEWGANNTPPKKVKRASGGGAAHPAAGEARTVKVVVVGDASSGKSAIVERYCDGAYHSQYVPTVGPQVSTCDVDSGRVAEARAVKHAVRVQFVELPVPESSAPAALQRHICDADGVIVVADTTRPLSVAGVDKQLLACKKHTRPDTVYAVFLHKSDRRSSKLQWKDSDAAQAYAAGAGVAFAASTTAAQSKSIEPNVDTLLGKVLRAGTEDGVLAPRIGRAPVKPKAVTVARCGVSDVGVVDEARIKQVERHVVSFLNVHTQAFGDYKRPMLAAMSSAAGRLPHNHVRVEASSFLEVDLHRECDALFERLKQLRLSAPLTEPAAIEDFLRLVSYFYRHLVPSWGRLSNELTVEVTLAQARGVAKGKAGVAMNPSQQGTAVIPPPALFTAYLRAVPDRPDPKGGKEPPVVKDDACIAQTATAGAQAGSLSSEGTSNLIGTSAPSASSVHVVSPINDSWECGMNPIPGGSQPGASAKPCSLSNLSEVKTPRFYDSSPPVAHPSLPVAERKAHRMVQADRDFLKALSQSRTDLRQLKDLLSRTTHRVSKEPGARLRQRSPGTHPQGCGGGKTVYTNSRISRPRGNSVRDVDGRSVGMQGSAS
eukprot:TRINITY_DN19729_c0_g1_i1.p1 TRINITY_DN19729_c0_g1~~TRINITY_DN19729_c0_g1_i1.p1  ORF type:complete len:614 (+),score=193.45 TRINITY_DN19729_c0_g1_i1:100-1941(+)